MGKTMCAKKVKNRKNNKNYKKKRNNRPQKPPVKVTLAEKTVTEKSKPEQAVSAKAEKTAEKMPEVAGKSQVLLQAEAELKTTVEAPKEGQEKPAGASESLERVETKVETEEPVDGKIEAVDAKAEIIESEKVEKQEEAQEVETAEKARKTGKIVYAEPFMLAEAPKMAEKKREERKVEKEIPKVAPKMGRRRKRTWLWWLLGVVAVALVTLGALLVVNLATKNSNEGGHDAESEIVEDVPKEDEAGEEEKPAEETPETPEEKPEEPEETKEEPPKENETEEELPAIEPRPEPVPDLPEVNPGVTKLVALTFDDGPSPTTTPRLLDILQSKNVKATFFVLGTMAQRSPDVLWRQSIEGHEVASHTMYHNQLTKLSAAQIRAEALEIDQVFKDILGHVPPFTRPPYGSYNGVVAEALGQPMILWSVDPRDWEARNAEVVRSRVVNAAQDGSIILLHDIHGTSVDAVPGIIDDLRARGFEFVTVSELAELKNVPLVNGVAYGRF